MDKNTIIGFVLIAAVLFGYSWFTKPTPEQLQELQRRNDSIAQVEQKKLEEIQQSQMVLLESCLMYQRLRILAGHIRQSLRRESVCPMKTF